ncbi:hypothetical protein [Promicromonospora sukumoe]
MSDPKPARLVPDELIPAAKLIARLDGHSHNGRSFEQGRGPLCFGNKDAQEGLMFDKAERYRKLADAYEDLGYWLATIDEEGGAA